MERAAALLTDLWAAAVRHGITPAQPGYHTHLPRAAFDSITAAIRTEHGWTIHTKHLRRRLTNPLTEAMQDFLVTDPTHTRRLVAELADDRRATAAT